MPEEFETGQAPMWWIFYGIIMPILVILFIFFISQYKSVAIAQTHNVETLGYQQMFLNSDCLCYQDHLTGRLYPGVIEKSKFNSQWFSNCFTNNPLNYGFRLTLIDHVGKILGQVSKDINTNFKSTKSVVPILVRDNNGYYNAKLEVEVWFGG
ncbi:hypothetical protein KY330_00795 [Candidatus Woesearchaeota archaeon]|nr:hypothetical protein [Candidatus Woesearchaeota archaeon]